MPRRLAATVLLLSLAVLAAAADVPRERSCLDASNRFLDKDFPAAKLVPSTTLIDSFEDWATGKSCWYFEPGMIAVEPVQERATDGKFSLKVTFIKPTAPPCRLCYIEGTQGWGNEMYERKAALSARVLFNDEVRVDVFNPGAAVRLGVSMGKDFIVDLKPGANVVVLKISEMLEHFYRITGVLEKTQFFLPDKSDKPVVLYFDSFRWVGPGVGENLVRDAKMFDFGSSSYCRPHFRNVDSTTGYTKEAGFGWEQPNKVVFEYSNNMVTQTSTGRQPHDELLRDYVYQINTPFLVDLPDGRYRVHVVEGANMGWYSLHGCRYDLTVVADGNPVLVRHAAKTPADMIRSFYGLDQTDYEPGENRFRKYLGPDCYPLEFDVDVKGGQLRLEFNTDPVNQAQVSFVILYPVGKAPVVEREVAALWRDIEHRFNDVSYAFATRRMAEEMHLPGLHEEYLAPEVQQKRAAALKPAPVDRARGYVLFNRDPMEEVYPDTVPAVEECGKAFAAFGPKDDIQSFAPAVYALRDLEDAGLVVDDFAGPGGSRIAKDRVDVRVVNCMYRMSGQQNHGDWRYVVLPWYLVKRDKVKVAAGTSRRWWINVDVPADAPPGRYVATATLTAKNATPVKVPLALDVLPFTLDSPGDDVEYAMYTGVEGWWYQQPFTGGWRYHISWRTFSTPEKKVEMNAQLAEAEKLQIASIKAQFDLLRRYGFNTLYQWRPDKDMTPETTEGLTVIPAEEEVNKVYPKEVWPMPPVHKVEHRKCAYLYDLKQFNETTAEELRKQGYAVRFNWILAWEDLNQEAGLNRFESGFLMWRLGAKGCVHNPWRQSWGNPYHPFDGHSGEWGSYCMPGSGPWPTLNPTVVLEGAREGIQDYRWLVTLERLIKEKTGTPAAAEAQKVLDDLRAKITPDGTHYFQGVGGGKWPGWGQTWSQKPAAWKGADYRDARRAVADAIGKLTAAK